MRSFLLYLLLLFAVPCALAEEPAPAPAPPAPTAPPAPPAPPAHAVAPGSDADLIHMETRKWDPASLLDPFGLMAMFSSEMLSVDYGAELKGGADRRTWKEILAYGPLPSWKVTLDEWRVLRPVPDTAIVSYRATGVNVAWKGWVTSVWALQNGKWVTVFHQASTAK